MLGFIIFMGLAEVRFRNCDDVSKKDRKIMCGTTGPVLAMVVIFMYCFIGLAFSVVWNNRHHEPGETKRDSMQEGTTDKKPDGEEVKESS
jgi:hypothetical protein